MASYAEVFVQFEHEGQQFSYGVMRAELLSWEIVYC
jgi:hypothetical protein